jgi:hypothetical protein
MREDDLLARVRELSRQQIAEYLLTGDIDQEIEGRLRRLYDQAEEMNIPTTTIINADFSGIYQELDNREVSASN